MGLSSRSVVGRGGSARPRVSRAPSEALIDTTTPRDAVRTLAFLGNHTPRQCGIATFTADLRAALGKEFPELESFVVAMNEAGKRHDYPSQVRFEIAEADLASYYRAADFLNVNDVDVLSLQHEYGIFGGDAGAHVLALLRDLRMPVVTTLHTILAEPNLTQRAVMDRLCAMSERLVVMSEQGRDLLQKVHGVRGEKIDLIPHGIPSLPPAAQSRTKLGVEAKQVLLTFGLLSPDKGIEHVIDALPEILRHFPEALYVVLGATHPHVKERHGEAYRLMLEARCHRLGVAEHVVFHDRFVSNAELVQFLSAADIYITPYLNPEQITSGTLAYAVGSGKAVISTPYRYARELLADVRGALVPFRDSATLATCVVGLLRDEGRRHAMEARALAYGGAMGWPVVARAYLATFERAVREHAGRASASRAALKALKRPAALPELNLSHLTTLTDDTGLLQHAAFAVPRYEDGYCVDDNARALLLLSLVEEAGSLPPADIRGLATRYLAFVRFSFGAEGRFRNFLSYSRQWLEECGSEDSHGRAVWSLGSVVGRSFDPGRLGLAAELFQVSLPATLAFTSPRAWAYTLLGIGEYLRGRDAGPEIRETGRVLAARLLDLFARSSRDDWPWFEDRLTYGNARLPQALMVSSAWLGEERMMTTALRALEWLSSVQRSPKGLFSPVGSNGFFVRGVEKARFDQQPVEACGMVSACLQAHRATGDAKWAARARQAFDWFLGQNDLDTWLYDTGTGGCRGGLHPERINENQGAESTLSFLMALMEMRLVERPADTKPPRASTVERVAEEGMS